MSGSHHAPVPLPPSRLCQSLSGYVREHLGTFERLLQSGTKYEALLDALVVAGFENPSYTALDSALYRARRNPSTLGKSVPTQLQQPSTKVPYPATGAAARIALRPTTDLKAEDLI